MRTERPASTRPAARTVLLRPLQEEHAPYFPPSVHGDNVVGGGGGCGSMRVSREISLP